MEASHKNNITAADPLEIQQHNDTTKDVRSDQTGSAEKPGALINEHGEAKSKDEDNDGSPRDPASSAGVNEYPGTVQVAILMACILTAIFLMSLDRTIVATAIPRITDEFNSVDEIGWYGSAYMLCSTCFQLMWGKVYTFYTPKWVFLSVVGLFEIGSAICGAAPNSIAFIIGRAIAGAGSAGILSGAIVLMAIAVPLPKRPFYNGFFSVVLGISSVVGPIVGGAITSNVSWRWCFYINLPIGGAAMLIILILLKTTEAQEPNLSLQEQLAKFDLLGECFLFPCLICLLLALQWGGSAYAWNNWRVILVFVLFGACLIAFIVIQVFTQKTATIKSHVITNRNMISAMWLMFTLSAVMQLFSYYLPLWFQGIKGKSAVQSGIDTLPLVISLTLASVFSGQTTGRIGYYTPLAMGASVFMPIGAGLLTTLGINSGTGIWIGYQILLGVGLGLGLQHGPMVAYTVLAPRDIPVGVSLVFFCQQLAGATFVSVGQNVFNTRLIQGLRGGGAALNPQDIIQGGATSFRNSVPSGQLQPVLVAYNNALDWVYVVGTVLACLSCFGSFTLEWKSVKDDDGPPPEKREKCSNEEVGEIKADMKS